MNAPGRAALFAVVLAIAAIGCRKESSDTTATSPVSAASDTAPAADLMPGADIPFVVPPPQQGHPTFAEFAWREFIALNWPSKMNGDVPVRGEPDRALQLGDATDRPRVWETWKTDWELFGFGGATPPQPSPWTDWTTPGIEPCPGMTLPPGRKVLTSQGTTSSKLRGLNQAIAGPLLDQHRNYARYEIRLNQNEYETIVSKEWFLADKLPKSPAVIVLDSSAPGKYGAMELKAAWRELAEGDDASRFYVAPAWKLDPGTARCVETRVALVGFHIAHKTTPFTQWVWSTFEHVDNVPPNPGALDPKVKYSFNNGTTTPPSPNGFDRVPAALKQGMPLPPRDDPARNPIQVTRFLATPGEVGEANQKFRDAAPVKGTVWANYILVNDQWPTDPGSTTGAYPAGAGRPFPENRVSNTTMETYYQNLPTTDPLNSCMSCHFLAVKRDYSYLFSDAWKKPAGGGPRALKAPQPLSEELRALQEAVRSHTANQ